MSLKKLSRVKRIKCKEREEKKKQKRGNSELRARKEQGVEKDQIVSGWWR